MLARLTAPFGRTNDELTDWQRQYTNNPAAFVVDNFKFSAREGPADYQLELLELLPDKKRIAVRGPHGLGKTTLASWIVLWAVLTAVDVKVPTTASAWRQLTKYLWPEIHKWASRLKFDQIGIPPFTTRQLMTISLELAHGGNKKARQAFAVSSDQVELIEGAHARRVVYVFDEAKAITDDIWDGAEGAFSTAGIDEYHEAYAIAISTPGEARGRFFDIHKRKSGYEDWYVRHITKDEAIAAGRMSAEWAEQRRHQWGENSQLYQNRVLGNFVEVGSSAAVIPLSWIEESNARWLDLTNEGRDLDLYTVLYVGVDVGDDKHSSDDTVIARASELICLSFSIHPRAGTMPTAGLVAAELRTHAGAQAVVDVIGIGSGVYGRLRELPLENDEPFEQRDIRPFNASVRPPAHARMDSERQYRMADLRTAAWWTLREALDPDGDPDTRVALPPDDRLTAELNLPEYTLLSGGIIRVESKKDIATRLRRQTSHKSTDVADAVIQAVTAHHLLPRRRARIINVVTGEEYERNN